MSKNAIIGLIALGLLIIGVITFYLLRGKQEEGYDMKIHFFNAGKADAIIISNNDKYMMIDTGEEDLKEEIINYFNQNNIDHLDALILTHFDKDHIGSAAEVIRQVEIDTIYQSNFPKDSVYYTNYLAALEEKNITPVTVSGALTTTLSDINITINGPDKVYDKNESNNSSLIVSMKYKENNFLFMGDSQNARIKDFVSSNQEQYDFLKVPYHGNYLKRLEGLLEGNKIQYAVITSSYKEPEEEETLELLEKYHIKTYLTREGSINVLSNGEDITIKQ